MLAVSSTKLPLWAFHNSCTARGIPCLSRLRDCSVDSCCRCPGFRREQRPLAPDNVQPNAHLSHQHQEVKVRREKGASEAGIRLGRPMTAVQKLTFRKQLAPCYFLTIGILLNVNSFNQHRDVNSAQSVLSRTGRLRNNQAKGRRRVVTTVPQPLERCTTIG